jgi:hypothetical protein
METGITFDGKIFVPNFLKICRFIQRLLMEDKYEGVSKSFRTGRLERELQMIQFSATRCSCIAIL